MKKLFLLLSISAFIVLPNTYAQNTDICRYMRLNPYSNYENPAYFIPYKGYVAFPAIGNLNFSFYNSALHYNNMFMFDTKGTPQVFTIDKFANRLSNNGNWLNMNFNIEILGFGFRMDKLFFSFGYKLKIDEKFRFSSDIFQLLANGNTAFMGKDNPANIDLNIGLNAYHEFSMGVHVEVTDRLYIGVRPKILTGIVNIKTKELNAKLYTDPDAYSLSLKYKVNMDVSTPFSVFDFTSEEYDISPSPGSILNIIYPNNMGAAIDVGGLYRINNNIGVSISATDIGFIRWKSNTVNVVDKTPPLGSLISDGHIVFDGLTAQQIIDLINKYGISEIFDLPPSGSVTDYIDVQERKPYTTALAGKFTIEGYYQLSDMHRFTALFKGYIYEKKLLPSFTVAYNLLLGNYLDVCVSYTMMKKSYDNLGVGLGARLGVFHIYLGTDNLLAFCYPYTLSTSRTNFQFGIVFDWGAKKIKEKIIKETHPHLHKHQ